jgi:hypothetical protein
MKRLLTALLIGSAVLSLSSASLAQNIRFRQGQTSQIIKDRYGSYNNTYTFRARKGQKLSAVLKSVKGQDGTLIMSIYSYCGEEHGIPLADRVRNWSGKLPCSDKYTVDVMTSIDAVSNDRPLNENYTLRLQIL